MCLHLRVLFYVHFMVGVGAGGVAIKPKSKYFLSIVSCCKRLVETSTLAKLSMNPERDTSLQTR